MPKRGRPSASSLNVVPLGVPASRPKLSPPSLLTKGERSLFAETTSTNPHLRAADAPLLAAYVQALSKTFRLARRSDPASVAAWEKSARVSISLATKLRITAQSQVHPESAGRQRKNFSPPSFYETQAMAEADDDGD